MNATPPEQTYLFSRFFFEMPPKILQMSSKPFKTARYFQQKSELEIFKINNCKQIRTCPRQYFDDFHLTPFLPPSLNPTPPIFIVPKQGGQLMRSQVTSGGQLIYSQTGVYVHN